MSSVSLTNSAASLTLSPPSTPPTEPSTPTSTPPQPRTPLPAIDPAATLPSMLREYFDGIPKSTVSRSAIQSTNSRAAKFLPNFSREEVEIMLQNNLIALKEHRIALAEASSSSTSSSSSLSPSPLPYQDPYLLTLTPNPPPHKKIRRSGIPPAPYDSLSFQINFSIQDFKKMHKNALKAWSEHTNSKIEFESDDDSTSTSTPPTTSTSTASTEYDSDGSMDHMELEEIFDSMPDFPAKLEWGESEEIESVTLGCYKAKKALTSRKILQEAPQLSQPLTFLIHEITEKTEKRITNEDRSLVIHTENYIVGCIFDGFNGNESAEFARNYFEYAFKSRINAKRGNFKEATQELFIEIHELAKHIPECKSAGSTACITLIDKHTGLIATGALADSETFIYDLEEGTYNPNTCVRNWTSEKDYLRALDGRKDKKFYLNSEFDKKKQPQLSKNYRVNGNNVSRAIGKTSVTSFSQKGKFTLDLVKPGNIVLTASDGLWDYLTQPEIFNIVKLHQNNLEALTAALIDEAKKNMIKEGDNVTIVAFKVQ